MVGSACHFSFWLPISPSSTISCCHYFSKVATGTSTLLRVSNFILCCPLLLSEQNAFVGRKKLPYQLRFVSEQPSTDLGWVLMLSKCQCEVQMILYKHIKIGKDFFFFFNAVEILSHKKRSRSEVSWLLNIVMVSSGCFVQSLTTLLHPRSHHHLQSRQQTQAHDYLLTTIYHVRHSYWYRQTHASTFMGRHMRTEPRWYFSHWPFSAPPALVAFRSLSRALVFCICEIRQEEGCLYETGLFSAFFGSWRWRISPFFSCSLSFLSFRL